MKKHLVAAVSALFLATAGTALAASRTVHLAVENMTCAVCPITVKKALERVPGVARVEVSYERKAATVTYDDDRTDVEALTRATTNAGYPSRLQTR